MNEPIVLKLTGCPEKDMIGCIYTELRRVRSNGHGLPESECETSFRAYDANGNIVPREGSLSRVVKVQVHSPAGILVSVYSCILKDGNAIFTQWEA